MKVYLFEKQKSGNTLEIPSFLRAVQTYQVQETVVDMAKNL